MQGAAADITAVAHSPDLFTRLDLVAAVHQDLGQVGVKRINRGLKTGKVVFQDDQAAVIILVLRVRDLAVIAGEDHTPRRQPRLPVCRWN